MTDLLGRIPPEEPIGSELPRARKEFQKLAFVRNGMLNCRDNAAYSVFHPVPRHPNG
jgi:hypothetical protein